METIGERIKSIRLLRGYTQPVTAEKAGMNTVLLRQYELGSKTPQSEQLQKIANALDVPVSLLTPVESATAEGALALIYSLVGTCGSLSISDKDGNISIVLPKDDTPDEVISALQSAKAVIEKSSTLEDVQDGEKMQMEVRQQKYAKSHLRFDYADGNSEITVQNDGAPSIKTTRAKLIKSGNQIVK